MISLGDRVEAWARRFGVPPPDVRSPDEEPERPHDDAEERPAVRPAPEHFTRPERERG